MTAGKRMVILDAEALEKIKELEAQEDFYTNPKKYVTLKMYEQLFV